MTDRVIVDNSTSFDHVFEGFTDEPVVDDAVVGPPPAPPREAASPWAVFAGVAVAAVLLAISPSVASKTFVPTYVVVVLIAAVGLVPLLQSLEWSRSAIPSWAAVAFVAVALLASLTSRAPSLSIFGLYLWGTGWLLWLAAAGGFAIGARLRSGADMSWLFGGLLVGAVGNALLALYQTLFRPSSATFGPYQGNQADGFLGNPIHLEALMLGTIALVAFRGTRTLRSVAVWSPLLLLMAVALEFTEERFAVILLPILFLVLVFLRRLRGFAASLVIGCGYLIGYLGGKSDLGHRLGQGTSSVGYSERLQIWRLALHAILSHPILGYGPGLFEAATAPHLTAKLSYELGPIRLFSDAHDVFIEVAVTTGVLGLICFVAWIGSSIVRARNIFLVFALFALAVKLVEPISIMITPLVFICLGASSVSWRAGSLKDGEQEPVPIATTAPRFGVLERLLLSLLVTGGLVLGTTMVIGDYSLQQSPPYAYVLGDAKLANEMLPYWPESASVVGSIYAYLAAASNSKTQSRHYLLTARSYFVDATRRDPFDPLEAAALGSIDVQLGQIGRAEEAFRRAYANDPWSPAALDGLAVVAVDRHQWARAATFYGRELRVLPFPGARRRLRLSLYDVRHHEVPPPSLS